MCVRAVGLDFHFSVGSIDRRANSFGVCLFNFAVVNFISCISTILRETPVLTPTVSHERETLSHENVHILKDTPR